MQPSSELTALQSEIAVFKEQIKSTVNVAKQTAMLNVLAGMQQKELFLMQRG